MDVVTLLGASDKSNMLGGRVLGGAATAVVFLGATAAFPVLADTMESALRRAYQNNPQLNAQRALVRATDENVSQALAGYRPKVTATLSGNKVTLSWPANYAGGWLLETSPDLVTWTSLPYTRDISSLSLAVTDPPQAFYRLRLIAD